MLWSPLGIATPFTETTTSLSLPALSIYMLPSRNGNMHTNLRTYYSLEGSHNSLRSWSWLHITKNLVNSVYYLFNGDW